MPKRRSKLPLSARRHVAVPYVIRCYWLDPADFNPEVFANLFTYLEDRHWNPVKRPQDILDYSGPLQTIYAHVSPEGWATVRKQVSRYGAGMVTAIEEMGDPFVHMEEFLCHTNQAPSGGI